ncbi:MAG: AAA family ATPase [Phaeodactylibacter sp.]|nr:AAA family ATPase [Phaeodactylibacter sp.]
MQTVVDEDRKPSRYILSGSQNFLLRQNITRPLAGRAGIARLFPLDLREMAAAKARPLTSKHTLQYWTPNHH